MKFDRGHKFERTIFETNTDSECKRPAVALIGDERAKYSNNIEKKNAIVVSC